MDDCFGPGKKAIDIVEWLICEGGRLEKFHCIWFDPAGNRPGDLRCWVISSWRNSEVTY